MKLKSDVWWGGTNTDGHYWELVINDDDEVGYQTYDADNKKLIFVTDLIRHERGNEVISTPPKKIVWSLPVAAKDLEEVITPDELLYDDICAFIMKYLELPSEVPYEILAAWVGLTWMPKQMLDFYPYIHFVGAKESGKTKALDVLVSLSKRAYKAISPTEAVLAREIERKEISVFIDELEEKEIQERMLKDLLNAGYKNNSYYPRCTMQGEGPVEYFNVSGFKAFTSRVVYSEILESRCITIPMARCINNKPLVIDYNEADDLRNRLYRFSLRLQSTMTSNVNEESLYSQMKRMKIDKNIIYNNTPLRFRLYELYTSYQKIISFMSLIGLHSDLQNKTQTSINDSIKPNNTLSTPITNNVQENEPIFKYFLSLSQDKALEDESSLEAEILSTAINIYNELGGETMLTASDIGNRFNEGKGEKHQTDPRYIGKILRAMGFKYKRSGTIRGYIINPDKLCGLKDRYKL